jgi:hypothetical protein
MLSPHIPAQKARKRLCAPQYNKISWSWPNCNPFHFSERLIASLRCYNFACDRIRSRSDHMCKVAAENTRRVARHWPCSALTRPVRAQHMAKTPLLFFQAALWPFVMLIICMCGRITPLSNHMQSVARKNWVDADVFSIVWGACTMLPASRSSSRRYKR